MFKNLLLEEDSDDSFSAGQEDVDIQVSISDFYSPNINIQQVGTVEVLKRAFALKHSNRAKELAKLQDKIGDLNGKIHRESNRAVWEKLEKEKQLLLDKMVEMQEEVRLLVKDNENFKGILGAIGASMFLNKTKANATIQSSVKCPTHKEVEKAAKKLEKTQKEYKAIKNKTNNSFDEYIEKVKLLKMVKQNYEQCQIQHLYH